MTFWSGSAGPGPLCTKWHSMGWSNQEPDKLLSTRLIYMAGKLMQIVSWELSHVSWGPEFLSMYTSPQKFGGWVLRASIPGELGGSCVSFFDMAWKSYCIISLPKYPSTKGVRCHILGRACGMADIVTAIYTIFHVLSNHLPQGF